MANEILAYLAVFSMGLVVLLGLTVTFLKGMHIIDRFFQSAIKKQQQDKSYRNRIRNIK